MGPSAPFAARIHCGARRQAVRARQVRDAVRKRGQGRGRIGHRLVGRVEGRAGDVDIVERGQRVRCGCRDRPRRGRRRGGGRERRQYGIERRWGVQGPLLWLIGGWRCDVPVVAERDGRVVDRRSVDRRSVDGRRRRQRRVEGDVDDRCLGRRRRQRRIQRSGIGCRRVGQRGRQRVNRRRLVAAAGERTDRSAAGAAVRR